MTKIKKLLTIGLAFVLMFCMGVSLIGCRPYPWEIEEKKIFDAADQIAKNPNYALMNDYEYRSAEQTVVWADLITEKIRADGKKVDLMGYTTDLFLEEPNKIEGGYVAFRYKYNIEFNWFGFNKNNVNYAIGTMSLDDYSFNIHYLELEYPELDILKTSETHFCCRGENGKEVTYLLINRENGKIEEKWDDFDLVKENFSGELVKNFNHTTYTENETVYTVYKKRIENKEKNILFDIPSYEYVMERSKELRQINVLAKATNYSVSSAFVTNGTDLFVIFSKGTDMFGAECQLIPVVFRCDLSFETFEYVGCMYHANMYYPRELSVIKIH